MTPADQGLKLQPLGPGDMDAVLALNEHWVPHVGSLDESQLVSLMAETDLALGAWFTGPDVASSGGDSTGTASGGALAGFVLVLGAGGAYSSPNYRYFSRRNRAFTYVDRIAVAPFAQGRGVGRALYERVVAHGRSAGSPVVCAEVNLEPPNPDSQAFHSAMGFVEVGRQWTYDDTVQVQLLERPL